MSSAPAVRDYLCDMEDEICIEHWGSRRSWLVLLIPVIIVAAIVIAAIVIL